MKEIDSNNWEECIDGLYDILDVRFSPKVDIESKKAHFVRVLAKNANALRPAIFVDAMRMLIRDDRSTIPFKVFKEVLMTKLVDFSLLSEYLETIMFLNVGKAQKTIKTSELNVIIQSYIQFYGQTADWGKIWRALLKGSLDADNNNHAYLFAAALINQKSTGESFELWHSSKTELATHAIDLLKLIPKNLNHKDSLSIATKKVAAKIWSELRMNRKRDPLLMRFVEEYIGSLFDTSHGSLDILVEKEGLNENDFWMLYEYVSLFNERLLQSFSLNQSLWKDMFPSFRMP